MEKENSSSAADESRRKFLEKAGKASVAAPAAAILLSGGIPTQAQAQQYGGECPDNDKCENPDLNINL